MEEFGAVTEVSGTKTEVFGTKTGKRVLKPVVSRIIIHLMR